MAITDPNDTLAFHQSRVLTTHRDMSAVKTAYVAAAAKAYLAGVTAEVPEREAVKFYTLNHLIATIKAHRAPLEPLSVPELAVVKSYYTQLSESAVRAFYYLLMICTRESRHNKSLTKDIPAISALYGVPMADFLQSISGGEAGIHSALLAKPPAVTIGRYVECLRWQFYNSKWNGGYGGKKWGQVTDCLVRFVTGEFTAEMMLDTIWTLCHNNGPIFNKGLCYSMYNPLSILRILDVQRSGQMPTAVIHDSVVQSYSGSLSSMVKLVDVMYPGTVKPYVDWNMVEALGAMGNYKSEQENQKAKWGLTPEEQAAAKKAEAEALAKIEAAKAAHKKFLEDNFEIMPKVYVPKIKRAA